MSKIKERNSEVVTFLCPHTCLTWPTEVYQLNAMMLAVILSKQGKGKLQRKLNT